MQRRARPAGFGLTVLEDPHVEAHGALRAPARDRLLADLPPNARPPRLTAEEGLVGAHGARRVAAVTWTQDSFAKLIASAQLKLQTAPMG